MKLPVNWSSLPCKDKYLDEETPELAHWFIFGEYGDGRVDVYNGEYDIFTWVPKDKAEELIKARRDFCQEIVRICNARQS